MEQDQRDLTHPSDLFVKKAKIDAYYGREREAVFLPLFIHDAGIGLVAEGQVQPDDGIGILAM